MQHRKLNILFLASWYPSRAHATLGNFVQRHAEAVATLHNVHVLYTAALPKSSAFSVERTVSGQVTETIVYYPSRGWKWWNRWRAFIKGMRFLQSKNEWNFDLVHLNVIWPDGWQALYLKWKFDLPFVVTEHWTGYDLQERKHPGFKPETLARRVCKAAALICPVTKNLGDAMQRFGLQGKYLPVPNVVNTALFVLAEKPTSKTNFLHVSSLFDEQKNISGLLRVWKTVSEKLTGIQLTIGGDGPWQKFKQQAEDLGISNISFFGEKTLKEVAQLMSQSHCLVLFSNFENLPCVIVEALASGMAVISTDVGGIREHINDARGYLVPKRDENALALAIEKFCSEHQRFKAEQLAAYAESHFSIRSIANQFNEVYQMALISNGYDANQQSTDPLNKNWEISPVQNTPS